MEKVTVRHYFSTNTFQHTLTQGLNNLNYKIALVNVDDILIFLCLEDHIRHLQLIFDRLSLAGWTLKTEEMLVRKEGGSLPGSQNFQKTALKWIHLKLKLSNPSQFPKNETEVKSFLGLCNFYRKLVKKKL